MRLRSSRWPSLDMLRRQANRRYNPGEIYVTENGVDVPNENSLALADALNDTFRVNFYQGYVQAAQQAVNDGVPLKGYFAWSLLVRPWPARLKLCSSCYMVVRCRI